MRTVEQYQMPMMFSMSHMGATPEQFSEQIGLSDRQIRNLISSDDVRRIYILALNYLIGEHNQKYIQCDYPLFDKNQKGDNHVTEGEDNPYFVSLSDQAKIQPYTLFKMIESAFISKEILYASFEREDLRQYVYDLEKLILSHASKDRLSLFGNEFDFDVVLKNKESQISITVLMKKSYLKDSEEEISISGGYRNKISESELVVAEFTIEKESNINLCNLSKMLYMILLLKFSIKLTRRCHSMYKRQKAELHRNHRLLMELNKEHRCLYDAVHVLLQQRIS